jgi:threonyl-tRNA synthetase
MRLVLPDGSVRETNQGSTGADIAMSISPHLAKASVAINVNGVQKDLSDPITENASISLITIKNEEGLEIMRHTVAAQVLGRALKNRYPGAKLAIGPTIKDGFYYDVLSPTPISASDLPAIEEEMSRIVETSATITKKLYNREQAIELFESRGEDYKVAIIKESNEGDTFQVYHQEGSDFIDLCRGPHLPSLASIGAFKLMKVAGAYWRGDSGNQMLTRVYGTAWRNNQELNDYIVRLNEAEKRDHRKLGQTMDLFHFQPETPGQVFWHNDGWTVFREVENYIRGKLRAHNYQEVNTPRLVHKSLFEQSGHWEKFGTDEMFVTKAYGDQTFALKPMNCPCHVQIFNHSSRSYRDLPIRMSEFGNCFRQERSSALHGLLRVASMAQDDAHIFCRMDQVKDEIINLNGLIKEMYAELGFKSFFVRFSDRPEQRVGDDSVWDAAEDALRDACKAADIEWVLNPGEGAFYGPKLEFVLRDAIGREWQCGTIQLDFNLPRRLNATYTDENNEKQYPVMIHRALVGTLERFVGILIEHFGGNFPLWLAPRQAVIVGVNDRNNEYVQHLNDRLRSSGIRSEVDTRNEKVSYKIREHMVSKVSFIGVIGDREEQNGTITVRRLGDGGQTINYPVEEFQKRMSEEIRTRALPPAFDSTEQNSSSSPG